LYAAAFPIPDVAPVINAYVFAKSLMV